MPSGSYIESLTLKRVMTHESHSELHRHLRLRRGNGKVLPNEGFFLRAESTYNLATHSPILLAYPDALILELTENGIRPVEYEDTEHFRLARDFLNHREPFLRNLLAD
jgi:predicted ATPase